MWFPLAHLHVRDHRVVGRERAEHAAQRGDARRVRWAHCRRCAAARVAVQRSGRWDVGGRGGSRDSGMLHCRVRNGSQVRGYVRGYIPPPLNSFVVLVPAYPLADWGAPIKKLRAHTCAPLFYKRRVHTLQCNTPESGAAAAVRTVVRVRSFSICVCTALACSSEAAAAMAMRGWSCA